MFSREKKAQGQTVLQQVASFSCQSQYVCFSRDLQNWISGIGGMVSSQELAEDLTGTEILIERHQVWLQKAEPLITSPHNLPSLCNFGEISLASSVSAPFYPQEQRDEIEAEAPTFQVLEDFGRDLISSGHRASPEIEEKLQTIRLERDELEKAWEQRKKMLDQCLELQVL